MATTGSYALRTFSTAAQAEIQRLQGQVELFRHKELAYYRRCGLQNGMAIAECGSGPGYLIDGILEAFPACHCTAVEIDPEMVAVHKERLAARGDARCTVVQSSILATGLADSSFDFVITRLVLEHLPEPLIAAREIWRILKPGGRAVFIDNDFKFHLMTHPPLPELDLLYEAYCKSMSARGGNPRIGLELPGLLKQAGFDDIDADILCAHSAAVGDRAFLKAESVGISSQLVKDGYLPAAALDAIAEGWHNLLGLKEHGFFRQIFCAAGRKNGGQARAMEAAPVRANPAAADQAQAITSCSPENRYGLIEAFIRGQIALATGAAAAELDAHAPLAALGFDSLGAIELKTLIKSELGIDIAIADFFMGQSIPGIARLLENTLNKTLPVAPPPEQVPQAEPRDRSVVWDEGII